MLKYVDEDPKKQERINECLCPLCFYERSRIGGSVVTIAQCAFCTERLCSGNTCVDVMCRKCAAHAGLCCHCGADLNLKNRRNISFPEKSENERATY